uniref:Uncharacterized protein n=1 Tax=Ciona intestinalis TaxID=7719 RepID=F6UUM2_CIOIN
MESLMHSCFIVTSEIATSPLSCCICNFCFKSSSCIIDSSTAFWFRSSDLIGSSATFCFISSSGFFDSLTVFCFRSFLRVTCSSAAESTLSTGSTSPLSHSDVVFISLFT